MEKEADEIEPADSHQHIYNSGKPGHVTEQEGYKIKAEKSDQSQFTAPIIAMVRAVPSKYLLPIKSPYPVCMKFAAAKSIQAFFWSFF